MAIVSLDNVTVSIEGKKLLDAVSLKAYPGKCWDSSAQTVPENPLC